MISTETFSGDDRVTVATTGEYTEQNRKRGRPMVARFVAGDRVPRAVAEQYGIPTEGAATDDATGEPAEDATMMTQTPATGPESTPESGASTGPTENTAGAGPTATPETQPAATEGTGADEQQTGGTGDKPSDGGG